MKQLGLKEWIGRGLAAGMLVGGSWGGVSSQRHDRVPGMQVSVQDQFDPNTIVWWSRDSSLDIDYILPDYRKVEIIVECPPDYRAELEVEDASADYSSRGRYAEGKRSASNPANYWGVKATASCVSGSRNKPEIEDVKLRLMGDIERYLKTV